MGPEVQPVNLLIVGAGMYVCGKGTSGFGTILPAAFEAHRLGLVNEIAIAATSAASARFAREQAARLAALFGVNPTVRCYPEAGEGEDAYLAALAELPRPCAAIVSVPDHLHFAITKELIEHEVHVQVVKPLVAKVAEARALVDLAARHGVYGAVEFHKRFDEANLKLYELIRQGALGELLNFRIQYSQRKGIPTTLFRGWVHETNIFQYLGVHYVDLIHFLTGARPLRVMSVGMKKFLVQEGIDTWDTIQTLIEWQQPEGGTFLSSHLTGWVDPETTSAMSDQRLEVIGTRGRYHSDQKQRGVTFTSDQGGVEEINPYFSQIYPGVDGVTKRMAGYGPQSVVQFLRDVADIVGNRRKVADLAGLRATFASSLPVAQVLEASQQSLAGNNGWIPVVTE
ncbi:MAG: Gfo/Idh/MocA family oxidoreductase [Thermodesulfobacteriota bacterium]